MTLSSKKIKSTGFFKPYLAPRNQTLKSTGAGCYIIKKNGLVVYVGQSSTDVKGTLYRHFQKWTDRRSAWGRRNMIYERTTYFGQDVNLFTVKVIFTPTAYESQLLEFMLIKKLKPRDNELKNELYENHDTESMMKKLNNSATFNPADDEPPF
jgi:excinuclease UvrABC nuclease subunit